MRPPILRLTAPVVSLARTSVDTDQIIPARFLTTTSREGLGRKAFFDWRHDAEGLPIAGHPFNIIAGQGPFILVAGENFGCGSSREHAPWALLDFGFRAVLATRIADIFRANALNNGLLAIEIPADAHALLLAAEGSPVTIDLAAREIRAPGICPDFGFEIDPFARLCLMEGTDPMGYLLARQGAIAEFEAGYARTRR